MLDYLLHWVIVPGPLQLHGELCVACIDWKLFILQKGFLLLPMMREQIEMMYRQLGRQLMMENGWELRHKARLGDSHPTEAGIDWLELSPFSVCLRHSSLHCNREKELLSRSGKALAFCHIPYSQRQVILLS